MPAPKGPRPITRARTLAEDIASHARELAVNAQYLAALLKSRDASSDTPDSKRRRPHKPAKRAR
jgi:hypothetical protein